jgi:hypothetical protein
MSLVLHRMLVPVSNGNFHPYLYHDLSLSGLHHVPQYVLVHIYVYVFIVHLSVILSICLLICLSFCHPVVYCLACLYVCVLVTMLSSLSVCSHLSVTVLQTDSPSCLTCLLLSCLPVSACCLACLLFVL